MPDYHLVVLSRAKDGQSAEFEKWYDDVHLSDVCKISGVSAARRFRVMPEGDTSGWESLAIYDLDGDPAAVLGEIGARAGSAQMPISDAMSPEVMALTIKPTKAVEKQT